MPVPASDQRRALWLSTIAFTVCFAVWTIFAIIGVQIKTDLGLNETQFGLLVGTPILTGSLIRLVLGVWSDQYGGRVVYVGKPHAPVYRACRAALPGIAASAIVCVGDSIAHDIKGANDAGLASAFVTDGIHAAEFPPGAGDRTTGETSVTPEE